MGLSGRGDANDVIAVPPVPLAARTGFSIRKTERVLFLPFIAQTRIRLSLLDPLENYSFGILLLSRRVLRDIIAS